jgi:hypothetical protein
MFEPINPPGCQVYVVAPDEDKVAELPAQTTVEVIIAVTGRGLTVMVIAAVVVPHAFCAVAVYWAVFKGAKGIPLLTPPDQEFVMPPLASNETVFVGHTMVVLLEMLSVGNVVFTKTASVVLAKQPIVFVATTE